jgi:beta-phosphoglucomutase-like phosphatase (HAD superfamily)
MELQALIFDVDGTLADTERDGHRPAFNAAFAEAGLIWHWDEDLYGELLAVSGGKERIRHFAASRDPAFLDRHDADLRIRALHAAKTRFYLAELDGGAIPLRPGVARLLRQARAAGLRLAIATTTSPENVAALLRSTLGADAPGWFEAIGAGDVVTAKKPAPDIYLWVLQRLGLPAAACLAFEDSANGLRSSLAAGLATVVTQNDYTAGQSFAGAAALLTEFGEPGTPFRILGGDSHCRTHVDPELLRIWHRSSRVL